MASYKVKTPRKSYEVEAESKNKARKIVLETEEILLDKIEGEDVSYWQRSERYKGKKLGNSNTDMQQYGCALMCWAYVSRRDPLEVNQLFIEKGVYNNDLINFAKACEALDFENYERNANINRMPTQEETIKEVQLGKGQHFVVRFNINGKRWIYDPWTNDELPINHYRFRSYRIFDK